MSKPEVLNFDNIVNSRIHTPRVDGNPLYARVDGGMDSWNNLNTRTDQWNNTVKSIYTSPDNIRRIFITHKGVYVHLYQPVVGQSKSLIVEKQFKVDIIEVYNTMANNGQSEKQYTLKGSGLAAIVKHWVCSNVEEVYFDWSVLLSQDVLNSGYGNECLQCIQSQGTLQDSIVMNLFYGFCTGNIKDLRGRFPRLRAVGYIMDLENIYHRHGNKCGMDSLDDIRTLWANTPEIKSAVARRQATICKVHGVPDLNFARSLKPNIYIYDRDVLDGYFNKLEARIKAYYKSKRDNTDGQTNTSTAEVATQVTEKSEFEILLDEINKKAGSETANAAIKIVLNGSTQAERNEIYNQMTESGKQQYSGMFK